MADQRICFDSIATGWPNGFNPAANPTGNGPSTCRKYMLFEDQDGVGLSRQTAQWNGGLFLVRLVPEPSSVVMLSIGVLALLNFGRRTRSEGMSR